MEKVACWVSEKAGRPWATILAIAVIAVWAVTGPIFGFSDTWQLVINTGTTIVTFIMAFLIQASQNRDGKAIQAKLDEVIKAIPAADNKYIGLDRLTVDEIEAERHL